MVCLSCGEYKHTQNYLDDITRGIHPLVLKTHSDIHEWKRLLKKSRQVSELAKPFDPDLHGDMEAFWLSLNYKGTPIACVGARLFESQNFVHEWITTYRFVGTKTPRLDMDDIAYSSLLPSNIKGRVVLGGGSWVHPDWRGLQMSGITSRLGKLFALRHLAADFYVAFIRQDRGPWAGETLGWPNSCLLSKGDHPTRDGFVVDVTMHWMDSWQLLNQDLPSMERLQQQLKSLTPSERPREHIDDKHPRYIG